MNIPPEIAKYMPQLTDNPADGDRETLAWLRYLGHRKLAEDSAKVTGGTTELT